jgi:hypothetical protein
LVKECPKGSLKPLNIICSMLFFSKKRKGIPIQTVRSLVLEGKEISKVDSVKIFREAAVENSWPLQRYSP